MKEYTTVTINKVDLPIVRKDKSRWGRSRFLNPKLTESNLDSRILNCNIKTDFIYENKYYYDLFDSKGNKVKEEFYSEKEEKEESHTLVGSREDRVSSRITIFFIDGEFKVIIIPSDMGMSRQQDIYNLQDLFSKKYKTIDSYTNKNTRRTDKDMFYTVFKGHSVHINHLIREQELSIKYKDLLMKKESILKLCEEQGLKNKFLEEWCDDAITLFTKSICEFLGLTKQQYKKGNYKVEHRLINKFKNKIDKL